MYELHIEDSTSVTNSQILWQLFNISCIFLALFKSTVIVS